MPINILCSISAAFAYFLIDLDVITGLPRFPDLSRKEKQRYFSLLMLLLLTKKLFISRFWNSNIVSYEFQRVMNWTNIQSVIYLKLNEGYNAIDLFRWPIWF
jgi:hypothetical protein